MLKRLPWLAPHSEIDFAQIAADIRQNEHAFILSPLPVRFIRIRPIRPRQRTMPSLWRRKQRLV